LVADIANHVAGHTCAGLPFANAGQPVTLHPDDPPSFVTHPNSTPEKGTVLETLDGNTVRVLFESDGKVYVVRYAGIEVPPYESNRNLWGQLAFQVNDRLAFAQAVLMFKDGIDKDEGGRLLRYVLAGDLFLNHELIRLGYATALSVSPTPACDTIFQSAEAQARGAGLGRWAGTPTANP
jgi:endonuclease YncB( thermonuclease family)